MINVGDKNADAMFEDFALQYIVSNFHWMSTAPIFVYLLIRSGPGISVPSRWPVFVIPRSGPETRFPRLIFDPRGGRGSVVRASDDLQFLRAI